MFPGGIRDFGLFSGYLNDLRLFMMKNISLCFFFGFFTPEKAYGRKSHFNASLQCARKLITYINFKKSSLLNRGSAEKLNKTLLNISNKKVQIGQERKLTVNTTNTRSHLMNLNVAYRPSFINFITKSLNALLIRNYDHEFDIGEFVENSCTALTVVTRFLSELRFEELNGLLTKECLEEVEKNVRTMEPAERRNLAVDVNDIVSSFAYETTIIFGGTERERIYYQITVVYHLCENFSQLTAEQDWLPLHMLRFDMLRVYNCRFIKEFTKESNGQWIINGINVLKLIDHIQQYVSGK